MARRVKVGDTPVLRLVEITKRFPHVVANDRVSLELLPGEIHALLGENGAGKSTLVKIAYGFYQADSGEIYVHGKKVDISSPRDARRLGIGLVFQGFTLIPALTVAENVALFLAELPWVVRPRDLHRALREASRRYGLELDPATPVWQLSVGEQQRVELLKLLLANARILIFDEPTKVLVPHEVENLFRVFQGLREDGYSLIFITHKLREALTCADRITVMRQGRVVGTVRPGETSEEALLHMMFGERLGEVVRAAGREPGEPILELRGVCTKPVGTAPGLADVDLVVRAGEIVGVAGVSGNGQRELGDAILGLLRITRGKKLFLGEDATRWPPRRLIQKGVAFVPEDPLAMAVVPWFSVLENLGLLDPRRFSRLGGLGLDWAGVRAHLQAGFARLGLNPLPEQARAATLSGGNLQRLVLVRELSRPYHLVVGLYPTRGLDVRSANAVRQALLAAREEGKGVLLISEDLNELFSLSDRIVVMLRGRLVGEFRPEAANLTEVGRCMTGAGVGHA
ncbi:MAG: ABC transporter ATP-binding protein [Candidatus Bipolaricaulota bacterium]|nr:ABC transporter ATP-binding protein [Candidatus Bipolaricaulota bacterium]MCX7844188.1 ABC transporter ATP-binding protein [Candidatus Bipolaricaulota bacterium]MDW8152004.1 ABC transporter ATP-binding protein [Candidatus Bipolaricaulota bacterium]